MTKSTKQRVERINEIFQNTISSIESSKDEIIDIVEKARADVKIARDELNEINEQVEKTIKEVDMLEIKDKKSRAYLSNVNKNFHIYSEDDLKETYDKANAARIELFVKREEEKNLITKRRSQELRLKSAIEVCNRAEKAWKSINVVTEYLRGNIDEILFTVDHLNKRQALGIKIVEAQEEERQRLARDIHDGPAQSMASLVIKAELCEKLMDIDKDKSKKELRNLKDLVKITLKDIRKIIYDLRPMSLDDLGLIPTLERYIHNFIEYTGIYVDLEVLGKVISLNSTIEIAVFRVIQEALSNINKHSQATEVKIIIEFSFRRLNISIIDNGIGFDYNEVYKKQGIDTGGYGLINMKERVELLEGVLKVKSTLGKGTKIIIYIVLPEEGNENEK